MTPLLLAAVLLAQRADTLRYTILQAGNRAGVELAVTAPDGSLYFFEEYNDRGRGPRLETRVTLTPGGLLQTLSITGHDYWKQPVDERFTLRGDTAEWSSSLERDRQRLTALYSPFYGPVAGMALFIGAAGPGGEVALLPAGRARVSKVAERTVTAGEGGGTVHAHRALPDRRARIHAHRRLGRCGPSVVRVRGRRVVPRAARRLGVDR